MKCGLNRRASTRWLLVYGARLFELSSASPNQNNNNEEQRKDPEQHPLGHLLAPRVEPGTNQEHGRQNVAEENAKYQRRRDGNGEQLRHTARGYRWVVRGSRRGSLPRSESVLQVLAQLGDPLVDGFVRRCDGLRHELRLREGIKPVAEPKSCIQPFLCFFVPL